MKTIFLKLSAAAVAAALLSPAFAAGTAQDVVVGQHAMQRTYFDKNVGTSAGAMTVQTWDVTAGGKDFLALCVEPGTPMYIGTQSYVADAFTFAKNGDSIARLYGLYYDKITGTTDESKKLGLSFQLALWELNNDDGNLATGTLAASVTGRNTTLATYAGAAPVVQEAYSMLAAAQGSAAYAQQYTFTKYVSGSYQDFVVAQAVSAVPEPTTYAMLGLGLALVGFTARRRKQG